MLAIVFEGHTYPCTRTLAIGRDANSDIVLAMAAPIPPDGLIGRLHARINVDTAGTVTFEDLSENGSWVNDQRVFGATIPLSIGDRIRIGEHELVVVP